MVILLFVKDLVNLLTLCIFYIPLPSVTFSDNEVDGETIEFGLTDTMIAFLFSVSFKKQAKFNKFVWELKDEVVTLPLQPVHEAFYVQPLAEER